MPPKQKKQLSKTFVSSSSYYSDLFDENTLHAVLIRSPISSGTIRSISLEAIPDGYRLFTSDDIPNENTITVFETSFPIFAKDKISYKGEPIGILTGKSLAKLHSLLQHITITYTEVFQSKESKQITDKNTIAKRALSYTRPRAAKQEIFQTISTQSSITLNLDETAESNGALCYANNKKLTIYAPTQWPKNLRENLEKITGFTSENIIIHKTKLPLSEKNAPWKNTTLAIQCALASILTKSSVLLSLSYVEQSTYDDFRNKIDVTYNSQITNTGKIISCDVQIRLDVGAYNPFAQIIVDRLAITSMGAYTAEKLAIEVTAVSSENPPATSVIRWLDYHCFYAIETHLREIAKLTDTSPHEVRMQNIFKTNKYYPFQFDTSAYDLLLNNVLQRSDFNRKYEIYKLNPYTKHSSKTYFPVRGIGLATAFEPNGFLGAVSHAIIHSIEVTIETNGKVIIKVLNASDTIASIWKEIASSILSVSVEDIIIDSLFYQNEEASLPETMLNNMYITAQLLRKACTAVQKLRFHQPLPISVKRTFNLNNKKMWNSETFVGKPFYESSWIALVAEIELVLPIYSYEVRNIYISIAAGNVMNKRKARYAIQSCVKRILSEIMKNQAYSEPVISITFLDSTDEPKQIRELVYNALPAALSNALSQTVQEALHTYPVAQERIYQLFQNILDANTIVLTDEPNEEDNNTDDIKSK